MKNKKINNHQLTQVVCCTSSRFASPPTADNLHPLADASGFKIRSIKILLGSIVLLLAIALMLWFADGDESVKVYPSKTYMCARFADSYLATVQRTDNITDYGAGKWNIAIDVETDLFNLCMLDLTDEALKNYKSTIIETYQK